MTPLRGGKVEKEISFHEVSIGLTIDVKIMASMLIKTACGKVGRLLTGSEALLAMKRSPHFRPSPKFDEVLAAHLRSERETMLALVDRKNSDFFSGK